MPYSMTGFGAAEGAVAGGWIRIEIRTVNHRHFNLATKLPAELAVLEGELRERLRSWVDENAAGERKSGDTNEQFYYKARKKAIGPFKREFWSLPVDVRDAVAADLERTFAFLFEQLNVNGTEDHIHRFVQAPLQHHAALKPALVAAEDDPDAGE